MTAFWLIRHGSHDWLGKALVGRRPGIHLNQCGHAEAQTVARYLAPVPLAGLYTSPLERTLQTAKPIALTCGLKVQIEPALNEIDFGTWTGLKFSDLASEPMWKKWNTRRSNAGAPGGETMQAVQTRILELCERLACRHPDEQVVLISHGDVLRALLAHVLGFSLDLLHTLEFGPGAVALIEWQQQSAHLRQLHANLELPNHLPTSPVDTEA